MVKAPGSKIERGCPGRTLIQQMDNDVIVFIYTLKHGWTLYNDFNNHRLALEAIERAPDQNTRYVIYWNTNNDTTLYPYVTKKKFKVFEYAQAVNGKQCIRDNGVHHQYCIKTDGMPFLFTDELFDSVCEK